MLQTILIIAVVSLIASAVAIVFGIVASYNDSQTTDFVHEVDGTVEDVVDWIGETNKRLEELEERLAAAEGQIKARGGVKASERCNLPSEGRKSEKRQEKRQIRQYSEILKDQVREYAAKNPGATVREVAEKFDVNPNTAKKWLRGL